MRRCPVHQSEQAQRLRVREQCLSFPLRNQESRGGRRRPGEQRGQREGDSSRLLGLSHGRK